MTTVTDTEQEVTTDQTNIPKCDVHWRDGQGHLQFVCGAPAEFLVLAHAGANLRTQKHRDQVDPMCERCLNEALVLVCAMHDNRPVVISYSRI